MSDKLSIQGIFLDKAIAPMLAKELDLLIGLLEGTYSKEDEPVNKILVALHRLKGSTGFIGLTNIESLARGIEVEIQKTSSYKVEGLEGFLLELKNLLKEINNALC